MKTKLTYFIFMLFSAFSVIPSAASTGITKAQFVDLNYKYLQSTTGYSNDRIGASIEVSPFRNQGSSSPSSSETETQIRWIQNATMSASSIEVTDSVSPFIEIPHPLIERFFSHSEIIPDQTGLFKILFRVIISPNAP